ncbi:MAG: ABC transporter ATP-binding protein [Bacteroidota bacterium]|jgi:ABC-2 type transport system ATP-binding protein
MHNDVILEIAQLRKTYESGHRALDGLSLSVRKGTIFGFLGLNGAGKTTTIRILAGLNSKDSGTVKLFGKEIDEHDYDHKQQVGFVLDDPLYFEWMSAGEYLRFVGTMYDLSLPDIEHRTTDLLEFFDLTAKGDDPIETYSTGMKKKISLAAAIIHKPQLIVLDEPLEGIDALAASSIKESLKIMAAGGTTIFITSHVLDTVEKLCDEVAIIHQGKVLLQCMTSEIRSQAKGVLGNETYASLEELFVDLVSDRVKKKHLSWL